MEYWRCKSSLVFVPVLFLRCCGRCMPIYRIIGMEDRASGYGPDLFIIVDVSEIGNWTLVGSLTGWLLFYFGFREANTIQSGSLTGICLMMSIFPAIATEYRHFYFEGIAGRKTIVEISFRLENAIEITEQIKSIVDISDDERVFSCS